MAREIEELIQDERDLDIQSEIEEDILRQRDIDEQEDFYPLKGITNYGQ